MKRASQLASRFRQIQIILVALGVLAVPLQIKAFALLGPVQPWMQPTNGVILPGDIGGPMDIGSGYRWNVPVVTYGFDQSFLDFFGTNGVAAVESAIKVLNDLPPVSSLSLTNYAYDTRRWNYTAQAAALNDLKTSTLSLLLEQLGLAQPTRNIFVLKQWDASLLPVFPNQFSDEMNWPTNAIPDFILQKNFDPKTLQASHYVNNALFTGYIDILTNQYDIFPFALDPYDKIYSAVADFPDEVGMFCDKLTFDDVGGLAYLYSTNLVNFEPLLAGVIGVGSNVNSFVSGAWRPGVDKITFVAQPVAAVLGNFLPLTNYFTDRYLANGIWQHQTLARIVAQPDFLFSAADLKTTNAALFYFDRTGTTNWLNHAAANGNNNGAGPGVIAPPVKIVFHKVGREIVSNGSFSDELAFDQSQLWGSFDASTNAPVIYPVTKSGNLEFTVRMWLWFTTTGFQKNFDWKPISLPGTQYTLQTATNLTHWVNLFTVTNDGSVCTYFNENPTSFSRFYRLVPQ